MGLVQWAALLRCRRIDFAIPEQFGGGDMGGFGGPLAFRPGLLRSPGALSVSLEGDLLGVVSTVARKPPLSVAMTIFGIVCNSLQPADPPSRVPSVIT